MRCSRSEGDDGPGPVVQGELVRTSRVDADEPDFDDGDAPWHVVDRHVGSRHRVEEDVAGLQQAAVAEQFQADLGRLEVGVRDAHEEGASDGGG